MSPWILGSIWKDLRVFYCLGLFLLIASFSFPSLSLESHWLLAFIILSIDSGHGYLTVWRFLWKEKQEKAYALASFAAVFGGVYAWSLLGIPYLWTFVVYFTIYHHYKQFYGLIRWYELRQKDSSKIAQACFRTMFFSSIAGLHFRPVSISFSGEPELFFFPNATFLMISVILYFLAMFVYLLVELRQTPPSVSRMSSVLIPSIFQGVCLFLGENFMQIAAPLLVIHGVTYWGLISKSIGVESNFQIKYNAILIITLATLFLAGLWEGFWHTLLESEYLPIGVALIVAPSLWHYWMDSRVWRTREESVRKIFYA